MYKNDLNKSGIYKIVNEINNKVYIGSSKNMKRRKRQHFSELRGNYHENIFLQKSWNKYGEKFFHFEIVEYVPDLENLLTREQHYIDKYFDGGKECYNMNPKAYETPHEYKPMLLYTLKGEFIKEYDSLVECSQDIGINVYGRNLHKLSDKIFTKILKNKYIGILKESKYIPLKINEITKRNFKEIYLIKNGIVVKKLYSISEVDKYLKHLLNNPKLKSCSSSLHLLHSFQGYDIVFKEDLDIYEKLKHKNKCTKYKYIVKYDFMGNLLKTFEISYGKNKFSNRIINNIKHNTRIDYIKKYKKDRKYSLLENNVFYLKTDIPKLKINTGISRYIVQNIETKQIKQFETLNDLYKFFNIDLVNKSIKYLKKKKETNKYIIEKVVY